MNTTETPRAKAFAAGHGVEWKRQAHEWEDWAADLATRPRKTEEKEPADDQD